ncbi:Myomesin-2 [Blyttiomyces sp. JEL0837]|nr:Myomesin-2 [Blyttiomyces sp. JEL0837]
MTESFFIGEIVTTQIAAENFGKAQSFTYSNPQVGEPHYFKVAAVNAMGVSEFSDVSDQVLIDFPPKKPSKPVIKKLTSSTIHLQSISEPSGGSEIECWKIRYEREENSHQIGDPAVANPLATTTIFTESSTNHPNVLDFVVDNLEPGSTYRFWLIAINACGESEESDRSDEVNLDEMVPVADPPKIEVTSTTSVIVKFPYISECFSGRPKLVGYKILVFTEEEQNVPIKVVDKSSDEKFCEIDGLEKGVSYYFAIMLVGENSEEGTVSPRVWVPLAAALPLPPSPEITSTKGRTESVTEPPTGNAANGGNGDLEETGELPPRMLSKSLSRSLTLSQRVQNMHEGNPAYHDPEIQLGSMALTNEDGTASSAAIPPEGGLETSATSAPAIGPSSTASPSGIASSMSKNHINISNSNTLKKKGATAQGNKSYSSLRSKAPPTKVAPRK